MEREIEIGGRRLKLVVERKTVKNVNARLRGDVLAVSAPRRVDDGELDAIIRELGEKLVRRAHARRVNSEEDAVALARRVASRFPSPPAVDEVVFVTTQRSRWGSYSAATRTVRLHALLRRMPRWVLDAVVSHELAHAVHPDHSPAFRRLLEDVCPDTSRAEAFLSGVGWLASSWDELPAVERRQLPGPPRGDGPS